MGSLLDSIKSLLTGGGARAEAPIEPTYKGQITPPAFGASPQENVNIDRNKLSNVDEFIKTGNVSPVGFSSWEPSDSSNSESTIRRFEGNPRLTPNQPTNLSTLLSKEQAGDASTTGESVASDVAVDNTGALGGMATDVSTTTTTATPTAVTPVAPVTPAVSVAPTGNTYSFEGDAATKGASGDVKSQAMYDLAQEALNRGDMRGAEAILRRPLNNQDFFPGPGLQQARTAWGDPLFTGAGQLFPMAVMDARQKAMAEAEAMAMREEALNFEIPKIEVAGLRNNYSQTFVSDAERLVSEAIAKYGNRRNAIRELKRSGEWARFMAEHKATADAINYTGKEAQTFLKNAKEGMLKGETYATPEALAAAQAYLLGLKEWGSGQINNSQLNQLAEQFKVWESWDKYEKNSRDRIKPTDITAAEAIAQQAAEKATQEDIVAFSEAVRLGLPGSTRGMKAWLYNKKISEVLAPQIRAAVIEPFFASNPSAERQFQARYPNMDIEAIKNLVAEQYAMGYGRQVEPGQITETSKGGFSINVGGDKSEKTGVYQNTVNAIGDITKYVKDNLTKLPIDKILSEAPKYGEAQGSWKPLPNYFGFELPGVWDIANQTTTPSKFNEYIYEVADKIPNKLTMKWLTAKDALQGKFNGDIPENMVPTGSKIKDVSIVYGVKDTNSAGGYKILDKEYVKSRGLPDNVEPLFLQKEELIFDINEAQQQTGGGMRSLEDRGVTPKKAGETRVSRSAYKIYPVTEVSARMYDQQVSTGSKTGSPGGQGSPQVKVSGSIDGEDFSSLD